VETCDCVKRHESTRPVHEPFHLKKALENGKALASGSLVRAIMVLAAPKAFVLCGGQFDITMIIRGNSSWLVELVP